MLSAAETRTASRGGLRALLVLAVLASATAVIAAAPATAAHRGTNPKKQLVVTVTGVTATSVSVAWTDEKAKDRNDDKGNDKNKHAVHYALYRDGTSVGQTTATAATIDGLACAKSYEIRVETVDTPPGQARSGTVGATTAACPDRTPPSVPAGLTVTATSETSISISWSPSSDNVGVTGYSVSRDGADAGTSTTPQATFDGLACGKRYRLDVAASDAEGNRSAPGELEASTSRCPADLFVAPNGADYRWTHLAATYDGLTLALYVNGVLVSSRPVTGRIGATSGPLQIGGNSIWGEWFAGLIDNVRVYNHALLPAEIQANMTAPVTATSPAPYGTGLVAAYSFDEGSGTTVSDASGNGNVGTVRGATWSSEGEFGGALSFDGVDDLVTVTDSAALQLSISMTLEAWVLPVTLDRQHWRTVVLKEGSNALAYALYADTDTGPHGHVFTDIEYATPETPSLPPNPCTDRMHPCLTLDHAYHVAAPGQVVEVAGGTYPGQTLTADPSKTAATNDVAFVEAPGQNVSIDGELIFSGATHVSVNGFAVHGLEFDYPSDHVTAAQIDDDGHLGIWGASNITVRGGQVYESTPTGNDPQIATDRFMERTQIPRNILIDGVYFHDWQLASPADHVECLQVNLADGLTIRNSRFRRCAQHALFINEYAPAIGTASLMRNVTLENNFFDKPNVGFYAMQVRDPNDAGVPCDNFLIRNNTFLQGIFINCVGTGNRVENNILPNMGFQTCATPGWTYSYNLIGDMTGAGPCDSTNIVGSPDYVDPGSFDLHLAAGSLGVNQANPSDFAPTDIDGRTRPIGAGPDIGATERG